MNMKKQLLTLTFLSFFFVSSHALEIKTYSGQMSMAESIFRLYSVDLDGTGSYEYYLDQSGKRIKHGKYSFANSSEQFAKQWEYRGYFTVEGEYSHGQKNGRWRINWDSRKYLIDFKDDKFNGDFIVSSRFEPSYKVVCHFHDNYFTGSYYAEGKWIIKGQFDNNGFVDGIWSVVPKGDRPDSYYFEFSNGGYVSSYGYDDSTGERFELKSDFGGSQMIGIFGPDLLVNYNIKGYIADYLGIEEFYYVEKPFLYVPDDGDSPRRSRIYNMTNALELLKEMETKRTEKNRKAAELAELRARPELAQPSDTLIQFMRPLFSYPDDSNKALAAILSKSGSSLRLKIPVLITSDGITIMPSKYVKYDAQDYDSRNRQDALIWILRNAKFYLLETTGLREEDQAAKEIGKIIEGLLPKLKDAPESKPGKQGSVLWVYVNYADGKVDVWPENYLEKIK